jgi:hypothetical protein
VFDPRGGHRAQACLGFLNNLFGNPCALDDVEEKARVLFAAVYNLGTHPSTTKRLLDYMSAFKKT